MQYRDMKMGEYLQQERYSHGFINNYVIPMCAAVWSVPKAQVRACACVRAREHVCVLQGFPHAMSDMLLHLNMPILGQHTTPAMLRHFNAPSHR